MNAAASRARTAPFKDLPPILIRFVPCRRLDLDPTDVSARDVRLRGLFRYDALKPLLSRDREQLLGVNKFLRAAERRHRL